MKEVSLSGSLRQGVGKKDAKAVRNAGLVPGVIYGGEKQLHVSLKHTELEKLVYTPNVYIINIDIEGTAKKAIIQDLQFHPVTDRIMHIDFIELHDDKKAIVSVPVILEGRAIGVQNGGVLVQIFRKLRVSALPENLPDAIRIDISNLRIGQTMRISDLATDGFEILRDPVRAICGIKMARGAVEDDEEEEEELEEGAEGAEGEGGDAEAATADGGGDAAPAEEGGEG